MNATKQMKQTPLQKRPVLDYSPPGLKKKGKQNFEVNPMVLLPSDTPESIAQYSIDLPSVNKDSVLDEMDMLKNITVHLNQIVQTMEHVYTKDDKTQEEGEEEEETLPDECEDMLSFLVFCSQLSNQLEGALREEKQILESLLKWFEKEVQMLEELGEEEIIPDSQVPAADKNITDNINKLINRIQRLEDLKGRVQELPKYIRTSTPRERRRQLGPPPPIPKDPKNIIEELAMKHTTEDVMNMVQVFQDDSGAPQTIESMNSRMIEIMKIFERQTNKLHRVTNEQDVLEGKLQKIQQEFRKLAEEKQIMEDELQKMKTSDIALGKASTDTRKKLLAKLEKEKGKVEEKTGAQPEKGKRPSGTQRVKESEAVKMKEDLVKAQANIQSLEREKKMLEERLQQVLEEAYKTRGELAEIPPDIPDWEFPYTAVEENEKDLPKKGKKGIKLKGKGEDRINIRGASVTDGTVQKTAKFDTGKAGETLPGKGQEIAPQARDGKSKKKGADTSETERGSLHKVLSSASEKLPKQPGKPEIATKSKETVELKKRRSAMKGTGKEPHGSTDTAVPPLAPDQQKQAESVPITSEKKKEALPAIISSVKLQKEKTLPVIEPEPADLVHPLLAESEEFMGVSESLTLEKASAIPTTPLVTWADATGFPDEIKDLVDEGVLQLVDHLTELKGMPEAETLAKLLLEPSKGLEALSDIQKLQLINHLMAPDGQAQIPVEEGQNVEQREKKRRVLANIASTLNLLDETQAPETGQTEEEVNEMAKMRRLLLADLESNLKDLQQAPAVVPTQEEIEKEINELTQKRSLLISALESNLKDLKEAQTIAATQPSEMSKNKVKELLQERAALNTCLEENQQDLQRIKSQEAVLIRKVKHEEEVNELSEKRKTLLDELEQNLNDLQEAQALAAIEPSSMNDQKIKELTEQRNLLTACLETNQQDLQRAQAYDAGLTEESRLKQEEINELSEKRKSLLASLKSNLKELQEAQTLAAIEPSTMNDEKIKELTEQRKLLAASLETNLQDIQKAQGYVPSPAEERRLKQLELNEQSEKKRLLQEKLESNLKELQEVQILTATQPSDMNELKLHELTEERKSLTTELEAAMHIIEAIQREKELNELYEKKQLLLKNLELNLKDLKETQALAAAEPDSMTEKKLQELTEQRRHLAAELNATLHHIEEVQHRDEMVKTPEVKLQELSDKKQLLSEKLELTLKELQQTQASAEAGGTNEQKLQELTEQRRKLTAELESAILDMQEIQLRSEIVKPIEKKVHKLSEKKQLLLENLVSNVKELQEAQPGSISEHRRQELKERGRHLAEDLEATVHDIKKAQHRSSGTEKELYDLSEKKEILMENLKSNLKELEEVQALAGSEPDSFYENKIQQLNDQRNLLSASLDSIIQQIKEIEARRVSDTTKMPVGDLDDLSQKKRLFLENLETNLKDLQEAETLASAHLDSIAEQKVQELIEQRRLLAAGLEAVIQDIEDAESYALDKKAIIKTRELVLGELFKRQKLFLDNLESNLKDLQQAQALAAAQPGDMEEYKVKELIEQRRLLTASLESIMQDIQEVQELEGDKLEILKIIEEELVKLSDNRKQLWENVELNLEGLQAVTLTEPGSMQEEKKQMLTEQRKLLTANLEALLQAIDEAPSLDLRGSEMTGSDWRNINYLFEIKRLESKLDEIEQIRVLSDVQLDDIKRKLCQLKEKRGLDRQDIFFEGPLSLTKEELATVGLEDKAKGKHPGRRRGLSSSPYLQKSIKDLEQKSMIHPGAGSDKELNKPVRERSSLEQCLVSIPLQVSEDDITDKYGPDDEQLAKRRALAAKLEANMKDFQAYYEAQQMKKGRDGEKLGSEASLHPLKPTMSGLQLQISKVPEIKRSIPQHDISVPIDSEVESERLLIQLQKYKIQQKEMELALRKQFMQQVKRTSLPYELTTQKIDIESAVQEILDSNKGLLPAHKANLPQTTAVAPTELQQANLIAAQKLLCSQPTAPNTTRFHEYSLEPSRSAWEGYQLPTRNYIHKLIALKRKLLSPEMKELLDFSPTTAQAPSSAATEEMDSILICGKGYRGSKHGLFLSHH